MCISITQFLSKYVNYENDSVDASVTLFSRDKHTFMETKSFFETQNEQKNTGRVRSDVQDLSKASCVKLP